MPRDVLLFLVLVAVLLNLALLVGAGIARWRSTATSARSGRPGVRASAANAPIRTPVHAPVRTPRSGAPLSTQTRPAAWSPAGVRTPPGLADRERMRPIAASPTPFETQEEILRRDGPLPVAATMAPPATAAAPAMTATLEAVLETAVPAPPDEHAAPTNGPAPAPGSAEPATRRGRRFVLPRNDEDKGRTERAIEAFLGEPAPSGSTSTHRPRRRARRHRTPGEGGEPLVLVAALGGYEQLRQTVGREGATRFAEAYGEALRATLRSGDNVTDLGQGRLRLVVIADEEGAQAMMERARAVCEPWLRLAPVPLALRVRPMPDPRSGNGHRPDGRSDRRKADPARTDGPHSGAEPVLPPGGRPNDAEGRRLAAG